MISKEAEYLSQFVEGKPLANDASLDELAARRGGGINLVDESLVDDPKVDGPKVDGESMVDGCLKDDLKDEKIDPIAQESPIQDLSSHLFKTTNRIIQDIRLDIPCNGKTGLLLNQLPLNYVNETAKYSTNAYEILTLNNYLEYCPNVEVKEMAERNINVITIRSLLVNSNEVKLSSMKVHHMTIRVVEREDRKAYCRKHKLHRLAEDEVDSALLSVLFPDKIDVSKSDTDSSVLLKCIAKVFDAALYKCSECDRYFSFSITEPEFDHSDLVEFELGPIQVRYTKALQKIPDLPQENPSPAMCLHTLFKVLRGPLISINENEARTININNPSLNSHLNLDLLLEKLYFDKTELELIPPKLNQFGEYSHLVADSYRRKLMEIIYLGTRAYSAGKSNQFQVTYSFDHNCSHIFRSIRESDFANSMHHMKDKENNFPPYLMMSCSNYYSDDLIKSCFQAYLKCDSDNSPYYVDALKDLVAARGTPNLETYYATLLSSGEFIGTRELQNAYRMFDLDIANNVPDDMVIAMYKMQLAASPHSYNSYRSSLKKIGRSRKSLVISDFLDNELMPLNLALNSLDCEDVTEDDILITAYNFKKDDYPSETTTYTKALVSIAVARKSYLLLDYIENEIPGYSSNLPILNYEEACKVLGCDLLANEFQMITIFQLRIQEPDSDIQVLRNALRLIALEKNSNILFSFLKNGIINPLLLPSENWPAGLDNIGNTCYLNSLLQYYFVIKPLRDEILKFTEYSNEDVDMEILGQRRIGGRSVNENEVKRSYQFVYQLRDLFTDMIHSKDRCVTPRKELAYLSFLPSTEVVDFRDPYAKVVEDEEVQITDVKYSGENEIDLGNAEVIRALLNSRPVASEQQTIITIDSPVSAASGQSSGDIEMIETLEDLSHSPVKRRLSSDSCEEITPDNSADAGDNSKTSEDMVDIEEKENVSEQAIPAVVNPVPLAPTTSLVPPPLPARVLDKTKPAVADIDLYQMENALEMGRQQDVTECIENVLFQIESAFVPEKLEEDKEQYDLVKSLFYGKTRQSLVPINNSLGKERTKIERFSNLIINISDHPKDMYDALDNYFGEDVVKLEDGEFKRSLTITELPKVLQVQIQRVLFDRKRLVPFKSIEPLPFGEKIYMDRYLDTEDQEIIRKRSEVFQWKSEINVLQSRKEALSVKDDQGMTIKSVLISAKDLLENKIMKEGQFVIRPETIETLDKQINLLTQELDGINNRLNELTSMVEGQFVDYTKIGYSIFAIFIHRGEASYGHYWIYIRDPKRNIFRKYNDETVTEVPLNEVMNFAEGNTATPYFIVYVKDDCEDYIEPLKREIE